MYFIIGIILAVIGILVVIGSDNDIIGFILAVIGLAVFDLNLVAIGSDYDYFSYPKIRFASFLKFYDLNPERWSFGFLTVACQTEDNNRLVNRYEHFRFGFLDTVKYVFYKHKLKRELEKDKQAEITKRMINAVKGDIERVKNLAEEEQKSAIQILTDIKDGKDNKAKKNKSSARWIFHI